jgi:hypothetical protein
MLRRTDGAAFRAAVEYQQVAHGRALALLKRCGLFQNLILERDAFRIVLFEPLFRGIHIGEYLDVVFVSDLLTQVDVNENGHWFLFS